MLCRRCGRRPSATSDGFCVPCKKMEVLRHQKLPKFNRRLRGLNRSLVGEIGG